MNQWGEKRVKPKAAFNIIISKKKLYMVQEEDKTWGFLGGGIEKSYAETSLQAACREAMEESDDLVNLQSEEIIDIIDISINEKFPVVAYVYDDGVYKRYKGETTYYMRFPNKKKLQNGETLQTKWFTFEEFYSVVKLREPLREIKDKLYDYLIDTIYV